MHLDFAHHFDFLCFAAITMVVMLLVHRIALRRVGVDPLGVWHRAGYAIFLALAWWMVQRSESSERENLSATLLGPLPTYAAEMQRLGHANISAATKPNDPTYLRMIEAEKRWLRVNPNLSDIYTLRATGGGKLVFVVGAESERRLSGDKVDGRVTRAKIGEPLPGFHVLAAQALAGQKCLDDDTATDRWGSWIRAYAPIKDNAGNVEAVLAVHTNATAWTAAIHSARLKTLGLLGATFIVAGVTGVAFTLRSLSRDNQRQRLAARQIEESRARLEGIINSIDGVVWEWSSEAGRYIFLSSQSSVVLGASSDALENDYNQWRDQVHPDDLKVLEQQRQNVISNGGHYSVDYRFTKSSADTIWIRERGVGVMNSERGALCLRGIMVDITTSKKSSEQLESLNKQMVESSRLAGMAEVACGVLHNVGNVLNSVNVSSAVVSDIVRESKVHTLTKLANLLATQEQRLAEFFTSDPRGIAVPKFTVQLARELESEHQKILKELAGLVKNITHVKEIIMMQQSFARTGGNVEPANVKELVEDALRMNQAALTRHDVQVVREFAETEKVMVDRNKVLQILINLIRNAKHAVQDCSRTERKIIITIKPGLAGKVSISISDNGIGMTPETLACLFNHGFTTKKNGHGFGLHSGMIAAREMGGALTATSDGTDCGATFVLELPDTTTANSPATTLAGTPSSPPLPELPALESTADEYLNRPRKPNTHTFERQLIAIGS